MFVYTVVFKGSKYETMTVYFTYKLSIQLLASKWLEDDEGTIINMDEVKMIYPDRGER